MAELQRRDQEAAEASARAQPQSEASARVQAKEEMQGKALEQMQAQAAADAEAARRAQALDLAGRLLAPQYAPPARAYPSQTICQRIGPQLMCNSN